MGLAGSAFAQQSLTFDLAPAGEQGDLLIYLRTLPHPVFERRYDGLLCNATISLLEALVGFEREVSERAVKEGVARRE
jgi:DnaJ-class molecular chaperone